MTYDHTAADPKHFVQVCYTREQFTDGADAKTMKTITVYGSSQVLPHQREYLDAVDLGRALAQAGYAVMNGGYYGIMEAVSRGANMAGGHVIGVTTDQIGRQFDIKPNGYLHETINFSDLRDRLLYMVEKADAYLAMPGGIGTLHEIAETWELMRIGGVPRRPFVCYGRLWADVIGSLENSAYLGNGYHGMIHLAQCPDEVLRLLA